MSDSSLYSIAEVTKAQDGFEIEAFINIQHPLIQDHRVFDKLVIAGAYWLESMLSVGTQITNVSYDVFDLVWLMPLYVDSEQIRVYFNLINVPNGFSVQVLKKNGEMVDEIAQARLIRRDENAQIKSKVIPIERMQAEATLYLEHEQIYQEFVRIGFGYGSRYSLIESLWCFEKWSLSKLFLSANHENYLLDPGKVDAALQTSLGIAYAKASKEKAHLPFSIKAIRCYKPLMQARYIYTLENSSKKIPSYHLFFLNAEGEVLVFMQDFVGRRPLNP